MHQRQKHAKFANRVDPDEAAHYEPPHQDHTVCPLVIKFLICNTLDKAFFGNFADENFVVCFFGAYSAMVTWQFTRNMNPISQFSLQIFEPRCSSTQEGITSQID